MSAPLYIYTGGFAPVWSVNAPTAFAGVSQRVSGIILFISLPIVSNLLNYMAMEEKEFVNFITEESIECSDYEFIHVLKDAVTESIIENRIYLWGSDIEDATEIIFPTLFNIVFNNHFNIRHNAKAINELIEFMLTHYA